MSAIGVYFGPKVIRIVSNKGRGLLSEASIPFDLLASSDLEDKVPEEIKLVALFKEELRKSNISAREAAISLPGKDMIVRAFEMPVLPKNEMDAAVRFEAKKYIPLKIEDLVFDYQVIFDKDKQKNTVLLVALKQETLKKYLSLFSQLGMSLTCVEYAAFSMLRSLQLSGSKDKGVVALVGIDLREGDEANFVVSQDGFPVFSRDINLSATAIPGAPVEEAADSGMLIEKLKTEIRISVDYYNRMSAGKNISKVIFLAAAEYQAQIEAFMKELGFACAFLDTGRILGKPAGFSLSLIKGYTVSLANTLKGVLKIDLLSAMSKSAAAKVSSAAIMPKDLLAGVKIDKRFVAIGVFICVLAFSLGLLKAMPLKASLQAIVEERPVVSGVDAQAGPEELQGVKASYSEKAAELKKVLSKQIYITQVLDIIPRVIPDGAWLDSLDYREDSGRAVLNLGGAAFLDDPGKEFDLVSTFLDALRKDPLMSKYFNTIEIKSLDTQPGSPAITKFTIECSQKPAEKPGFKEKRLDYGDTGS